MSSSMVGTARWAAQVWASGGQGVVDPGQRLGADVVGHGRELALRRKRHRAKRDHRQRVQAQPRRETAIGLLAPGGGPHQGEPGAELPQPVPVPGADPDRLLPREQLVLHETGRAARSRRWLKIISLWDS
jgi:hypothetical protein